MADDERRAEIEAVAQALAGDDQGPWYAFEEDAEKAIAALDRARDARHDDECERLKAECCTCEKCGHVQAEPNWCHRCRHRTTMPEWAKPLVDAFHERQELRDQLDAARSPQGEDHETARIAAHEAAQDYVDAAGGDEVDTGHVVDEALNAYLARVSPSRDGTVAVEALRAIRTFAGEGPHTRMGEACGIDACVGCLIYATADEALAEFGVSGRIHDQATKEDQR